LNVNGTIYSYSLIPYNHVWNITANNTSITSPTSAVIDTSQEIQFINGTYHITGPGITLPDAYLDYTGYIMNNNTNYSGVPKGNSSYRFATFVWNFVGPITSSTFSKMNFVFNNFLVNGSNNVSITQSSNGCYYITDSNNNTQRYFLDYRIEQYSGNSITVVPTGDKTSDTSVWVDGNSGVYGTYNNTTTPVFSNDYNNPQSFLVSAGYNSSPIDNSIIRANLTVHSYSNNNLIARVNSIIPNPNSISSYYIYCRIGLPMINNYSFQYVSLYMSN
jgi:hypothetical protein